MDFQSPEFAPDLLQAERKKKIAEALLQASAQPNGQMVSGIYVSPSITQRLAGLLNAYSSNKLENEAGDIQKKIANTLAGRKSALLAQMPGQTTVPYLPGPEATPENYANYALKATFQGEPEIGKTALDAGTLLQKSVSDAAKKAESDTGKKVHSVQLDEGGKAYAIMDDASKVDLNITAPRNFQFRDVGGVTTPVDPRTGQAGVPLSTLPQEAGAAATIAGARKSAEVKSEAQTQAGIDLNSNLDEIAKMRENVSNLIADPGFGTIYSLSGKVDPRNYIAGTDAANAEARRKQLEAASFGIAIQKMKGFGQLSNAEGLKVTQAYTRAIDRSQSEEAAKKAWEEVLGYLDLAESRAKQKAGVGNEEPAKQPSGWSIKKIQ